MVLGHCLDTCRTAKEGWHLNFPSFRRKVTCLPPITLADALSSRPCHGRLYVRSGTASSISWQAPQASTTRVPPRTLWSIAVEEWSALENFLRHLRGDHRRAITSAQLRVGLPMIGKNAERDVDVSSPRVPYSQDSANSGQNCSQEPPRLGTRERTWCTTPNMGFAAPWRVERPSRIRRNRRT